MSQSDDCTSHTVSVWREVYGNLIFLQFQYAAINFSSAARRERKAKSCQRWLWCMALQVPPGPWAQWSVYWSTCVLLHTWRTQTVRTVYLTNVRARCVGYFLEICKTKYRSECKPRSFPPETNRLHSDSPVLSASQAQTRPSDHERNEVQKLKTGRQHCV